jgi:hypothetical protein
VVSERHRPRADRTTDRFIEAVVETGGCRTACGRKLFCSWLEKLSGPVQVDPTVTWFCSPNTPKHSNIDDFKFNHWFLSYLYLLSTFWTTNDKCQAGRRTARPDEMPALYPVMGPTLEFLRILWRLSWVATGFSDVHVLLLRFGRLKSTMSAHRTASLRFVSKRTISRWSLEAHHPQIARRREEQGGQIRVTQSTTT